MTAESTSNPVLDAVLNYARRGLYVLPLVPREKRPLLDDWPNACSTDEAEIHRWFDRWPDANVGIATGKKSGITVLDFDGPSATRLFLQWWDKHIGGEPQTPCVETGGGGRHYYFKYTPRIGNSAGKIFTGWDVRNDGGQAAAPPSIHPNGTAYKWLLAFDDCELIEIPEELLCEHEKAAKAKASSQAKQGPIPFGRQESTLSSVAGAMRRQGAEVEEIEAALLEMAKRCDPPMSEKNALRIARSISRYDPAGPLVTADRTDLGNAERFTMVNLDRAVYVAELDTWFIWDNRRWERVKGRKIDKLAKETARAFQIAAAEMPTSDASRDAIMAWANDLGSNYRLNAMVAWARSEMEVDLEVFDADPLLLNCANGTVDLRTGELRPHNPADRISKITNIPYDPEATCPMWDSYLNRAQSGNVEMLRFLHQLVGLFLTGRTTEKVLPIIHGPQDTGKTIFTNIMRSLLGEYAQAMKEETLAHQAAKNSGSGATPDVARLLGARLAIVSETGADFRLNEARVKAWTGNNPISARELHKPQFDFEPTHKLLIETNNRPIITGNDGAVWRRVKLIKFEVTIPRAEQDPDLIFKLQEELPGILAWAVRGSRDWLENGLIVPNEVQVATDEYEEDMDQLQDFIEERCIVGPEATVGSTVLLAMYNRWAKDSEVKFPLGRQKFNEAMRQRGMTPWRDGSNGNLRSWRGIGLRTAPAGRSSLDDMTKE